jgi:hypothetical protein
VEKRDLERILAAIDKMLLYTTENETFGKYLNFSQETSLVLREFFIKVQQDKSSFLLGKETFT